MGLDLGRAHSRVRNVSGSSTSRGESLDVATKGSALGLMVEAVLKQLQRGQQNMQPLGGGRVIEHRPAA